MSGDFRLPAGGLFFFRRRKKNQERRHQQIGLTASRRILLPFWSVKKEPKIFLKFLAYIFSGGPPQALLLSSPKEVSKKGATVSTRWTPTRERGPLDPARHKTCSYRPTGFYPAHPAGRGCRSYRSGKMELIGPTACKERVQFAAATKNVSPGLQGKAGSSRE